MRYSTKYLLLSVLLLGFLAISALGLPEQIASRINVFFAGILAIITMIQMIHTRDALDDSKKDRKVEFISKQLEDLYYPLSDFLNEYKETEDGDMWGDVQQDNNTKPRELWYSGDRDDAYDGCLNVFDMRWKKYLFQEKRTKAIFRIFTEDGHCSNYISTDNSLKMYDELKELVDEDIHMLELELRSLTT
ncbi:MAG: hypothetical protein ACC612_07580 [Methanomethylovorans sp.]|uniref:hypothetical protein n=1 Tax=Methanomethylovorans sp. TaxID=2758717 RepID=UPI0035317AB3